MGDPRKIRGKFQGPRHPWNKERIDSEKVLLYNYGLVNKRELWKVESKLKNFKDLTKHLVAQTTEQSEKEKNALFGRLKKLGIMKNDATADDVLGLGTEQLLDRRLQTIVYKQDLARSIKQARQFITHGHIIVGKNKVTIPGYIVSLSEESQISFVGKSSLANPDHPERVPKQQLTGANESNVAKSAEAKAKEEAPVTKTVESDQNAENNEKTIEEKIEEETTEAKEVKEAVEETEADKVAEDKEAEVKEEAAKEEKEKKEAEEK